jgi:selenocysteine lyase/cysteine desulfurase
MDGKSPLACCGGDGYGRHCRRAGDLAALPLLKRFGVSEAARASAYVYSTTADLDRLADALLDLG